MITCPTCGHENDDSAISCRRCSANLQSAFENPAEEHKRALQAPIQAAGRGQSAWAAAFSILLFLCALLLLIPGIFGFASESGGTSLVMILVAVPYLVSAVGLFKKRWWGRWLAIIVCGLGVFYLSYLLLFHSDYLTHYFPPAFIITILLDLGLVTAVYWLATHGEYFR